MTVTEKRLYGPQQPGTTPSVLYTVETNYLAVLKQIILANTSVDSASVSIGLNGTDNSDLLIPSVEIKGQSVHTLDVSQPVEAGETIEAVQGTSGAITVTIGAYLVEVTPVVALNFEPLIVAEAGDLNVVTSLFWRYVEFDSIMAPWRFTLGREPTGQSVILDVLVNDVSVFDTPPEIEPGSDMVYAVPDRPELVTGDEIRVAVTQVGSGEPGGYLTGTSRYTEIAA